MLNLQVVERQEWKKVLNYQGTGEQCCKKEGEVVIGEEGGACEKSPSKQ